VSPGERMILSRATESRSVQIGGIYRHRPAGTAIETAEVIGLLDDRSGIPHVRFMVRIERQYRSVHDGPRTLSVTSFLKYYNELI
jgi:hypothetical protein